MGVGVGRRGLNSQNIYLVFLFVLFFVLTVSIVFFSKKILITGEPARDSGSRM